MAIAKYTALASVTLTSPQLTISFGNIPSEYRDLRLVMCATNATTATATDGYFRLNSDSGAYYNRVKLNGSGSTATSASNSSDTQIYYDLWSTSSPVLLTLDILDYSQTDKHKSMLLRGTDANSGVYLMAARYAQTTAINSITFYCTDQMGGGTPDSFAIGSTFTLYGVK